jgi:HEAT repeat protein
LDSRVRAANALGVIDDDSAKDLATKTLSDGNLKVRLGAAVSLFRLNSVQ